MPAMEWPHEMSEVGEQTAEPVGVRSLQGLHRMRQSLSTAPSVEPGRYHHQFPRLYYLLLLRSAGALLAFAWPFSWLVALMRTHTVSWESGWIAGWP